MSLSAIIRRGLPRYLAPRILRIPSSSPDLLCRRLPATSDRRQAIALRSRLASMLRASARMPVGDSRDENGSGRDSAHQAQRRREALAKIGVTRMTVCDAQGYARQRGKTGTYRGNEYKTNLLRKIALEIVVNEDFLDRTIETVTNVARTGPEGNIGDGKIFVLPAVEAIEIGRDIRGPEAV